MTERLSGVIQKLAYRDLGSAFPRMSHKETSCSHPVPHRDTRVPHRDGNSMRGPPLFNGSKASRCNRAIEAGGQLHLELAGTLAAYSALFISSNQVKCHANDQIFGSD